MSLMAHVYSGYASYENVYPWNDDEHVAHKFIQILKGEPANGYAWLTKPGGSKVKISSALAHVAFDAWASWAATRAVSIYPRGAYLVPIPSASCLSIGSDQKGQVLASAVAERALGFTAIDALHWKKELVKASKGGPRDEATLFGNVRVLTGLPNHPVILIDDVVTGGGHALACAKALRWAGHEVQHVIAAARTVKQPPAGGMFNIPSWDIEAQPAVF